MRIGKYIGGIALAGMLALGWACSDEEPIVTPPVGPDEPTEEETILEAVTIQFGPEGTVETRAYGDDNARDHEFMNSLIAFIVDAEGQIEVVINATDSIPFQNTLTAQGAGNVDHYSTTVDLTPGAKTIYAFANMDKVKRIAEAEGNSPDEESFEETLEALKVGDTWPTAYATAVIDNPAAAVNLEGDDPGFIPMSVVRRDVNMTVSGQQVNIELVRLVSRVDITLQNQQGAEVTVSDLTMSDFADRVALFEPEEDNPDAPTDVTNSTKTFNDRDIKVPSQADPTEIVSFYVNETWDRTDPFSVALTIDGKEMTGETKGQTIIRRNHILPLALRLAESALYLEVTAQVAPIGGYPVAVYLDGSNKLTDTYEIALPEGCTFSVEGYLVGVGGEEEQIEITGWSWTNNSTSICELESPTGNPIVGHLTALPEQEVSFGFEITDPVSRTDCSLTIQTKEVGDKPWESWDASVASLRQWQAKPTLYELIPLRVANPE